MAKRIEEELWDNFLQAWPTAAVRSMTIEQYTNTDRQNAYTYWLEFRLAKFGRIKGGSAFKWGVYRQKEAKVGAGPSYTWDGTYAWEPRFGQSAQAAFAQVHERLVNIVDAVERDDFAAVEKIDLAAGLKWKTALLYQNRERPRVFCVFLKKALFASYQLLAPEAKMETTPQYLMYQRLLEKAGPQADIVSVAEACWTHHVRLKAQANLAPKNSTAAVESQRFYKCSPGANAQLWPQWRQHSVATIGWHELGDLTSLRGHALKKVLQEYKAQHPGKGGLHQVATFLGLRPGDRIVANRGKSELVGIGTVLGGYKYAPNTLFVDGGDHPHQLPVRWDVQGSFPIDRQIHWSSTIMELDGSAFAQMLAATEQPGTPAAVQGAHDGPHRVKNVIFQGPPGTGKTYATKRRALELLGHDASVLTDPRAVNRAFCAEQAEGRIVFVTFHQSYGYEEFVEGIRPVLRQDSPSGLAYTLHDGVFKRIALEAAYSGLKRTVVARDFDQLWAGLQADLDRSGYLEVTSQKGYSYRLSNKHETAIQATRVVDGESLSVGADSPAAAKVGENLGDNGSHGAARKHDVELIWRHREALGVEPEKFTYAGVQAIFAEDRGGQGGHPYTVCWLVYAQLLARSRKKPEVARSRHARREAVRQALVLDQWDQNFEFHANTSQYVLVIDEINRGNISKIFGELITLIEPSKRMGMPDALGLPLANSPDEVFAVPPNLHIIGTMNTADRSIAVMDYALRRRFVFEDVLPDGEVLRRHLAAKACPKELCDLAVALLTTMNRRICALYDEQHQLGHAEFMSVDSIGQLLEVMFDKVIPTLREYEIDAWDKLGAVLGCPVPEKSTTQEAAVVIGPDGSAEESLDGDSPPSFLLFSAAGENEALTGFDDDLPGRPNVHLLGQQWRHLDVRAQAQLLLGVLTLKKSAHAQRLEALLAAVHNDSATP